MKNKNLVRRITSGFTALATAAACSATGMLTAPTVIAAEDTDNYAKLLQYSLYMYDANMCGSEVGEKSGFSWRDDCHTDDAVPGGYHDCGDHVKFGITAGYSGATLGWSYYEYKDVFDYLGQTGHLKLITDHFCKYFKDCTTISSGVAGGAAVTDFVYQIGDGNADHNSYWGPPEQQDSSSRKVFKTSSGASDVAAEYAAALAVNYINFGNKEDLTYAEALFDFSTKFNQVASEGVTPFYTSSNCEDDQSFAAGFLYLATKDEKYNTFLKNHQKDPNYEHCWDNVYLGAAVLNGEINGDWSIPEKYAKQRMSDPTKWYTPDGWGAARYNTSAQYIGLLLKKYGKADHTAWCQGQMDMILGKNPKNVCLVVGFNDVSAKYPHHEAASGLKGWDEYNAAGATFGGKGHTLTGALEGGFANAGFQYVDALNDITSSEVGIDYNATLVAAAAGLYKEFGTGKTDSKVNGVERNIQYENPDIVTTTSTTETTTTTTVTTTTETTTTTVTTTAERAVAIVNVSILDPDTGKQVPGVKYQISGYGENGAYFGQKEYTSGETAATHDVNWHDLSAEAFKGAIYWELTLKSIPDEYAMPAPVNTKFSIENGKADVKVTLAKKPDMSKLTFELIVKDKITGEYIPGVEVVISGKDQEKQLPEKKYTTLDGVNDLTFPREWVEDLNDVIWTATITSVPEGYKMPDEPKSIFMFLTKNTVEKTYELERAAAPKVRWGDANLDEKVTVADAVAILQSLANKDKFALKPEGAKNADVYANGDGITAKDALIIQMVDAGAYKQSDLPMPEIKVN